MTFYMLTGNLCLSASDSFWDVGAAGSDCPHLVFGAPNSGVALDLSRPGETEGGFEEGVKSFREEGQRVESGGWTKGDWVELMLESGMLWGFEVLMKPVVMKVEFVLEFGLKLDSGVGVELETNFGWFRFWEFVSWWDMQSGLETWL